jgi:PEP-CTERM motif
MKGLTISAFALIALLGASGEAAAMASNHHRYNGGGGGGGTVQTTELQIGPDAPGSQPVSVPEPGTLTLTALGLGAVAAFLRKARRRHTR